MKNLNQIKENLMIEWISYNREGGKLTWKEYKQTAGVN